MLKYLIIGVIWVVVALWAWSWVIAGDDKDDE